MRLLAVLCFLLSLTSCSGVFYHPNQIIYGTPERFQIPFESLKFKSKSQGAPLLHAWWLRPLHGLKPKATIVFLHGNAENLTSHFMHMAWLTEFGYQIFIFDYQGYGASEGVPSQQNLYQDALAAYDEAYRLHQKSGAPQFIVYGQSLGGVVSLRSLVDSPTLSKVDLYVLDSTYMSYQDIAYAKLAETWFLLPFSPLAYLLISDEYSSEKSLAKLGNTPLLVIHGTGDEVVPYPFGEKIYEDYTGPKWHWKIPGGQHTDVFFGHAQVYRDKFLIFLKNLKSRGST